MHRQAKQGQAGFSLIEMMVALVVSSLLMTGLFQLWNHNKRTTDAIANKGDFRDRVTLATTQVNRSITMAGFGISKMEVIRRQSGNLTDTLTVFSNQSERRTTLTDSASAGAVVLHVFKDSGFAAGGHLGITDSLKSEFARIDRIEGTEEYGFKFYLSGGLTHAYSAGVPHIYPVQKERIFADEENKTLVRFVGDRRQVLGEGINQFRVQLLDQNGSPAALYRNIRVVTFSLSGTFKAPVGTPSMMSFSSTVIPRNIL